VKFLGRFARKSIAKFLRCCYVMKNVVPPRACPHLTVEIGHVGERIAKKFCNRCFSEVAERSRLPPHSFPTPSYLRRCCTVLFEYTAIRVTFEQYVPRNAEKT